MDPLRRLELQIAGKSEDDDPDYREPDDPAEQDGDEGDDDGSGELDREERDDLTDKALDQAPEDVFADTVLVPLYKGWQARSKDPGAPWPARFPIQLHPAAHEKSGKFAARVAAYYRRRPEAADAFRAVGEEPEWTDFVTGAMRLAKGTGSKPKAPRPAAKPTTGGPDASANRRPGPAAGPNAASRLRQPARPAAPVRPAPDLGSRGGGGPGGARSLGPR